MKMKTQKSIISRPSMKNLMVNVLPIVKKVITKKINQIKSAIKSKVLPNRLKKRQNTPKRVSNRGIKPLENNFNVKATKNIISIPKIVIEKPQIVAKPEIVTMPKITTKRTKVGQPKIIDKSEIFSKKYDKYKKRVIKQLKKLFDTKKVSI